MLIGGSEYNFPKIPNSFLKTMIKRLRSHSLFETGKKKKLENFARRAVPHKPFIGYRNVTERKISVHRFSVSHLRGGRGENSRLSN